MKERNTKAPIIQSTIIEYFFDLFRDFVHRKTGTDFSSFAHPYLEEQEKYKHRVHIKAREKLNIPSWNESLIASGDIIKRTIDAIEFEENNLLTHIPKWGDKSRDHKSLYEATEKQTNLDTYERALYDLFKYQCSDEESFNRILELAGKRYKFLAYLFFIKDNRKYCPISPEKFDETFSILKINFKTNKKCSWENYIIYNSIIDEIRHLISVKLDNAEVHLLDAHSFLWIIGSQMKSEIKGQDHLIEHISQKTDSPSSRGITGKKAEEYFIKYYDEHKEPVSGDIEDCREHGIGYDFRIENNNTEFAIEVKGLSGEVGGIVFTDKEWETAKKMRDKYFLVLIKNLDNKAMIHFIKDPYQELNPNKNIQIINQITWNVSDAQINKVII